LKSLGFNLPDSARLAQVQRQVLHAAPDRSPEVDWEGAVVRRYRDHLYALAPQPRVDSQSVLAWDLTQALPLPDGSSLVAVPLQGKGVKSALCRERAVTVRYRQGGEACHIAGRGVTRPLKKLLQEAGVPPWERERIPLIYVGGQLAAVAGHWLCAPCQADAGEEGITFEWRRAAHSGTLR
jgi:tRNA(Ile)-lysidine synthase